jgi:hypothetical protein
MAIERRVGALPWERIARDLDDRGWSTSGPLLTAEECGELISRYDDDEQFRSRVVMARHSYGRGEYKYFRYPLPALVEQLRQELYKRLVPVANRWREAFGQADPFPKSYQEFLRHCHEAGQTRPTPLLLRYGPSDYNCLHQDLYGQWVFPIQAAFLLSDPGRDFTGGEFILTEQRPRMQSRAEVVPLRAGEAVLFAVNQRPVQGTRGPYRVTMRHGVSTVRTGNRHTLGIIFHDAD